MALAKRESFIYMQNMNVEVQLVIEYKQVIVLVDDSPIIHIHVKSILSKYYQIESAYTGESGLRLIEKTNPNLVLIDIGLPDMLGYDLIGMYETSNFNQSVPFIFLTSNEDLESERKCFESGGVDFLRKPFSSYGLLLRVRSQMNIHLNRLELEKTIFNQSNEISTLENAFLFSLANIVNLRDDETGDHIKRIVRYAVSLANELSKKTEYTQIINFQFLQDLAKAAQLHDIGKLGISDLILKKPGKLTSEEFQEMKRHTLIGADFIQTILDTSPNMGFLKMAYEITRYHHENWDGTGYPLGLKEKDIPLSARIISIVDMYDALVSKRVYKEAYSHEQSMVIILAEKGKKFDPTIVESFQSIEPITLKIHQQFEDNHHEGI